jgi:4-carboxymuconolactone decarboxylase
MSRMPLRPGDADDVAAIYDRVTESAGGVPNLYRSLAHAPKLLEGWITYAWTLRADAVSDRGLRELLILRVAQLTSVDYVWRSHYKPAMKGGVEPAKLDALANWAQSDLFSGVEQAALLLTDELTESVHIADSTWDAVRAHFDDQQAVELVLTIAWYCNVARVNSALGVPLEAGHDKIPPLPPATA